LNNCLIYNHFIDPIFIGLGFGHWNFEFRIYLELGACVLGFFIR